MRHRWWAILSLVALALTLTPAAAEVVDVNPQKDPVLTLQPEESQRLATLQHTTFASLSSDISPDDTSILHIVSQPDGSSFELNLTNINDGSSTTVTDQLSQFSPYTELRWSDAHTLVYVSVDFDLGPVLVQFDRDTQQTHLQPISVTGYPISLAPNGSRLLVARPQKNEDENEDDLGLFKTSPFQLTVKRSFDPNDGLPHFEAQRQALQVSERLVDLLELDLQTGESTLLISLPEGSGFVSAPAWTPNGDKLALAHTTIPKVSRSGTELSEKTTQDALGYLAPADNPFFQKNAVSIFDFANQDLRPNALQAKDGTGDIFGRVAWSTDGQTLMTQMQHPAKPAGRKNPTYLFPDRSYLRFYNASLQPIGGFDSKQTEAPETSVPQFVSPDEVIITAPYGLSYRLFYYNRISGEFRQISAWDGTYYQVRASRISRQLVYSFSSFQNAPDLYRISWEGSALSRLTWYNGEAETQNHIRADQVSFTMKDGSKRSGYLLQPADAAFPPRNVRIVLWQEGGPGGTMTNQWGDLVERPLNLLPNFGIAVLMLPLPGREGFGPAFYNKLADSHNFGSADIDEAATAVQQMIQRGWTSKGKVGITGCSYGGYFTTQSLVRHPDLYAAANTQCTLLDLFTEWELGYTPQISYLEGAPPTTGSAEYLRDSPIYNASKIKTPLLIFAGTADFLPSGISTNLHDQVATTKTSVKFLKFQGEGHGLSLPNNQTTAAQAQISWFREYLK